MYNYEKLVVFCLFKLQSDYTDVKAFVYIVLLRLYEQSGSNLKSYLYQMTEIQLNLYAEAVDIMNKDETNGFKIACNHVIQKTKTMH
jgi:late competence protein required for DNA uptake (superfamily II DNA/RNA helicase)